MARIEQFFKDSDIELIDLTNHEYDPGYAVGIVSYTCDPKSLKSEAIISEMVRPIVKYKGKVFRQGMVILSQKPKNANGGKND